MATTVIRSPERVVPVRSETVAFSLYLETISFMTKIASIDFSLYYDANLNTTISIKPNTDMYPAPYLNPIFINKVKSTVEELKYAIQILNGFINT